MRIALCFLFVISANLPLLAQDATPLPSVTVAEVKGQDITPSFSYIGRIEAADTVELRARVQGFLEQQHFQEGRYVEAGDLLFTIEKAPYQVIVEQRKADLAGAEANLKNAGADLARKKDLVQKKVVSQAELDAAIATEAIAEASVLQAKAALQSAELDLSYTDIHSPIDGQISRARYSIGNLVGSSSEPLATVTRVDPVYVTIGVSDKDLIEARRQGIDLDNPKVAPFLTLADDSRYPHDGEFNYLDTQVNRNTDTVTARAVFANPDKVLLPGQFVTVHVQRKEPVAALVIPQAAMQRDQKGYFVLVVTQADKVEVRRVEAGEQIDGGWVIKNGLAAGERVIVQGVQKVRPDMQVNPVES